MINNKFGCAVIGYGGMGGWHARKIKEEMGEYASFSEMIVNFFTAEDFVGLLSRRAMLPLIVFSVLFGFSANL